MVTKRTAGLPLICLVCGDSARGINFDVMTCMSCKTFFRRHAQKLPIELECKLNHDCQITKQTRGACSGCRLKKCFALGMNHQLIRRWSTNQVKSKQSHLMRIIEKNDSRLPEPLPLNLLRNDRSTLTNEEWNLLSNIIHAYDETNAIPNIKCLLEQQSSLLPKVRSKSSITLNIIKNFYSSLQPFVERSPYFHHLSTDTCRALIQHNSVTFGTLNSFLLLREVNAFDNPAFRTGCHTIYGHELMRQCERWIIRLESNVILVKIMLFILAFSINSHILTSDYSEDITSTSSAVSAINVQNIFVTIFWRYLIYQFGFTNAVKWFNSFIKYVLDVQQASNDRQNVQHNDMVDSIVEEKTRLLRIDD